jgi:UDP-N-acetylmuramyl pentapeptide phosphotransferase/UDP-N-acetylglucosamine-1-phosphate transferase
MAAAMLLWGNREGSVPIWLGLLIFSPFLFDATLTLVRRAWRRERVWEAHRTHYYQRLVGYGWSRGRVLLAAYLLMAGCGGSALLAPRLEPPGQWILLSIWLTVYLGIAVGMALLSSRCGSARQ